MGDRDGILAGRQAGQIYGIYVVEFLSGPSSLTKDTCLSKTLKQKGFPHLCWGEQKKRFACGVDIPVSMELSKHQLLLWISNLAQGRILKTLVGRKGSNRMDSRFFFGGTNPQKPNGSSVAPDGV